MTRILLAVAALLSLPAVAAAQTPGSFGIVSVTVRPATADVFIDGERWVTSDTSVPLVVRLPPGRHTIDVRARGYRPFATVVDVRAEESTPLNVILPAGPADPGNPPPFAPQPPPSGIHQVSQAPSGDGFVFAPDFKITELNHRTTGFAGMYGGAVFAGQFLLGGGAYVQLDDYNSEQMVYGGLVSEWRLFHDHPVGLTLHGLAGWGEARTGIVYAYGDGGRNQVDPHHGGGYYGYGYGYPYGYEGFFIAEPEAQVVARFGSGIRLVGGIGYRFTTADFSNLDGITGSIAVQFGR
jgi:hypothetical protein